MISRTSSYQSSLMQSFDFVKRYIAIDLFSITILTI